LKSEVLGYQSRRLVWRTSHRVDLKVDRWLLGNRTAAKSPEGVQVCEFEELATAWLNNAAFLL